MPYKKIEDRRKCWKRWYEKHKSRHKENQSIQVQARRYHKKVQVCSIKKCKELGERHHPDNSKPKEILWLCKKHHEQIHHSIKKYCSLEGCNEPHCSKGFCNKHYHKFKRGTLSFLKEKIK